MSALRPLQLVDGPTSPGPSSAPYSSLVSPPPSATFAKPDRRLSLQLQSPRTPSSPAFPSAAQLKRHSSQSQGGPDRQVLTLAERHADLLRFIAQKESKCLELRQQLAQHEADLLALKRKWERIVSRGTNGASTSSMPTPSPSNRDSLDIMSLGGGLKDGVGRMLSGLGEMFPAAEAPPAKQDAQRSSLSGSSASTLYSEPEREEEEPESSATTPADELLVDLASPVDDKTPSPPPAPPAPESSAPSQSRSRPRPHSLSSPLSPSPLSPSPVPLHSAALAGIVPMVNRKWEEFKGTETLQKSQKRASMLLNDVFAALVPPPAPTPTERRRASGGNRPLTGSRPPTSGTPLPSRPPSTSSSGSTTKQQPAAKPRPQPSNSGKEQGATRDLLDDDDDWNW